MDTASETQNWFSPREVMEASVSLLESSNSSTVFRGCPTTPRQEQLDVHNMFPVLFILLS